MRNQNQKNRPKGAEKRQRKGFLSRLLWGPAGAHAVAASLALPVFSLTEGPDIPAPEREPAPPTANDKAVAHAPEGLKFRPIEAGCFARGMLTAEEQMESDKLFRGAVDSSRIRVLSCNEPRGQELCDAVGLHDLTCAASAHYSHDRNVAHDLRFYGLGNQSDNYAAEDLTKYGVFFHELGHLFQEAAGGARNMWNKTYTYVLVPGKPLMGYDGEPGANIIKDCALVFLRGEREPVTEDNYYVSGTFNKIAMLRETCQEGLPGLGAFRRPVAATQDLVREFMPELPQLTLDALKVYSVLIPCKKIPRAPAKAGAQRTQCHL